LASSARGPACDHQRDQVQPGQVRGGQLAQLLFTADRRDIADRDDIAAVESGPTSRTTSPMVRRLSHQDAGEPVISRVFSRGFPPYLRLSPHRALHVT
jgi:hypothetical protein